MDRNDRALAPRPDSMSAPPPLLKPLLDDYVRALAPVHPRLHGVYVYGSVALGAFDPRHSDIDVVCLTRGALSDDEIDVIELAHAELGRRHALGRRLEVAYVPLPIPDVGNVRTPGWPVHAEGVFRRSGRGDVNAVTWWTIEHRGIRLLGPEPAGLALGVPWSAVVDAMNWNLEVYWADRASDRRGDLFLSDYWVEFGVSTVCRILVTLEDREIVSKPEALDRCRRMLPEEWLPLIDEAARLRARTNGTAWGSREERMQRARAFVAYARERGATQRASR